jgi:hypothetical protein
LGEAHAFRQDHAEAVQECGLSGVGLGDATQADLAVCRGRQHDIVRLNARKLFKNRARRISEPCTLLPHLKALPQHEGEKANQDMGLNAILALMPDRPHLELVLVDAESGLGLGELNIGFPQLSIAPIADVGAQQIGAL